MKKNRFETALYSVAGIVAMFLILTAANFLAGRVKQRVDLTAERAYTLSAGTRAILAKLDTPVVIRFYCTQSSPAMPVVLKTYAAEVEDLLGEYRQASHGMIQVKELDPEPDSDAEDSAKLDGVEGQPLPGGERIYLGLSVSLLDQKSVLPFLTPDRERLLEYDISRAITRVMTPAKPVIGVMTPLQAFGQPMNMMMLQQGQRGAEPWALISELQHDFEVKQVDAGADKIDDAIKVLIVIHPKAITDVTQYALDQFVLRGGKLIAFLDPLSVFDTRAGGLPSSSTFDKLLKAWGIQFDDTKVVADMEYAAQTQAGRNPCLLSLNGKAMDSDDIVTSQVDSLLYAYGGAFTGTPAPGLKETVLLKSSSNAELVDDAFVQMAEQTMERDFRATGMTYTLALRLSGTFKTAFPDGKPNGGQPAEPGKKPDEGSLKKSARENEVVLVGDSDLLQDQVAVQELTNPLGQHFVMPRNGNLNFAQSMVEQLSGDSDLITVRSRTSRDRPFTVVQKMTAEAEASYRSRIKGLESDLAETQRKLAELQRGKEEGERFILSPEQQTELENFRKKEADVRKDLKTERKKLREETDALQNRIKWLNIAAMPAVVALAGIGLAIVKRNRTAAK